MPKADAVPNTSSLTMLAAELVPLIEAWLRLDEQMVGLTGDRHNRADRQLGHIDDRIESLITQASYMQANDLNEALLLVAMACPDIDFLDDPDVRPQVHRLLWSVHDMLQALGAELHPALARRFMPQRCNPHRQLREALRAAA